MSYCLRDDETLREGVRRIVCTQIDAAISATALSSDHVSPVHETRKRLKRARAALALLEKCEPALKKEQRDLRKVGHLISDIRDAEVRLETIKELRRSATDHSDQHLRETEELLAFELDSFLAAFSDWQSEAAGKLRRVRDGVSGCALSALTREDVCREVRASYRRGRRAARKAQSKRSSKSFHQLRKRTKALGFQLRILRPLHPAIFSEMIEESKRIGGHLGHANDLSFVVLRLETLAGGEGRKRGRRALEALIESREKDLQRTCLTLAERFYLEKPAKFAARIADYFEEWERSKLRRATELSAA